MVNQPFPVPVCDSGGALLRSLRIRHNGYADMTPGTVHVQHALLEVPKAQHRAGSASRETQGLLLQLMTDVLPTCCAMRGLEQRPQQSSHPKGSVLAERTIRFLYCWTRAYGCVPSGLAWWIIISHSAYFKGLSCSWVPWNPGYAPGRATLQLAPLFVENTQVSDQGMIHERDLSPRS